ncbi:MAG: adenylyltransferase/cytidyltransferase family protein [Proteobacteria bacterium]|nr:adenylyltransferase/cytidyltransferase family protein [Pseudomonadota bacterium]
MSKRVLIAGGFDPIHRGHLDHIVKAKALGDWLIVIIPPDDVLIEKKGYCLLPELDRFLVLNALPWIDEIYVREDTVESLRELKPDIYAKGGDRTPENMLQVEIDVCEEIGCELIYGVGALLNSSSEMFRNAVKQFLDSQGK